MVHAKLCTKAVYHLWLCNKKIISVAFCQKSQRYGKDGSIFSELSAVSCVMLLVDVVSTSSTYLVLVLWSNWLMLHHWSELGCFLFSPHDTEHMPQLWKLDHKNLSVCLWFYLFNKIVFDSGSNKNSFMLSVVKPTMRQRLIVTL